MAFVLGAVAGGVGVQEIEASLFVGLQRVAKTKGQECKRW